MNTATNQKGFRTHAVHIHTEKKTVRSMSGETLKDLAYDGEAYAVGRWADLAYRELRRRSRKAEKAKGGAK